MGVEALIIGAAWASSVSAEETGAEVEKNDARHVHLHDSSS